MKISKLYKLVKEVDCSDWPSAQGWSNSLRRSEDGEVHFSISKHEPPEMGPHGYCVGEYGYFDRSVSVNSKPVDLALQEAIDQGEGIASTIAKVTIKQEGRDEHGSFDDSTENTWEVTITFRRVEHSHVSCYLRLSRKVG